MNYLKRIREWSDEQWYHFGLSFLEQAGWERDWKSDFDVFSMNGKRFLVKFRHNIKKGPIGTQIESDLVSSLKNANACGFIGFYSGEYTTSLAERINKLNFTSILVSGIQISVLLPYCRSSFIDEHFVIEKPKRLLWHHYLNKEKSEYKPLYCICGCGSDILANSSSISCAAASVYRESNNLFFIYGLKDCIFKFHEDNTECGWVEINQILHPDQFNIWNSMLHEYLMKNPELNLDNYLTQKRSFNTRILQRMRSVNAGFFLMTEEFE